MPPRGPSGSVFGPPESPPASTNPTRMFQGGSIGSQETLWADGTILLDTSDVEPDGYQQVKRTGVTGRLPNLGSLILEKLAYSYTTCTLLSQTSHDDVQASHSNLHLFLSIVQWHRCEPDDVRLTKCTNNSPLP